MEITTTDNGIGVYYEVGEEATAGVISAASERAAIMLQERWGLVMPADLRVYVMTSWQKFIFHAAPLGYRIYIALVYPLFAARARQTWAVAGGWQVALGKRQVVGVKPYRLIRQSAQALGERIFVREEDPDDKIRHVTCHELTHAFTNTLKLPTWFHEGLAMLAVDRLLGRQTVKTETLQELRQPPPANLPERYTPQDAENYFLYHYVRGYWTVRYLDECYPDLLRGVLGQKRASDELAGMLAEALNLPAEDVFTGLTERAVAQYD